MNKADKLHLRLKLVEERGSRCENPDCNNPASDLHHGCIGDKKRLKDVLFTKFNLVLLCRKCNTSRIFDNEKGRQYWWDKNLERYGDKQIEWLWEVNAHCVVPYRFKDTAADHLTDLC